MTKPKTKPTSKSKPKPVVSLPIPAPPVTNYAGLLEQIAMSMQDLVAEMKAIAEIPSLLDDVLGELKSISTSMSTLSSSIEGYIKSVDDNNGAADEDAGTIADVVKEEK